MNRKKIAFVIYGLSAGGAERVLTSLANELVSEFDVLIVTLVKSESFYHLDKRVEIRHCFDEAIVSRNGIHAILNNWRYSRKLARIVKTENINLLIGFTTTSNVISIMAAKMTNIKCMACERNSALLENIGKAWKLVRNFAYKYADYLVVQTNGNKAYFENKIAAGKIGVLANPISREIINNRKGDLAEPPKKNILTVGRMVHQKAHHVLLKAFAAIDNKDYFLVMVGDGPRRKELQSLAKDLNIAHKVKFEGKRQNVHDYYNSATIFAFTSLYEGFPNALMEALYFGVPCISTNCPDGPADLIQDGKNGFLIEVNNQKQLEEKLMTLMNNKNLRVEFSINAKKSTEQLEMEHIIKNWKTYIYKLI